MSSIFRFTFEIIFCTNPKYDTNKSSCSTRGRTNVYNSFYSLNKTVVHNDQ